MTDPQHPLFGKRFAVLGERSGRGAAFVVVGLPDGRRRSIRIACTDLAQAALRPISPPAGLGRISVRTLIPLMQHLRANLLLPAEEVIRDGRSALACRVASPPPLPPPACAAGRPAARPPRLWPDLPAERRRQIAQGAALMRRMQAMPRAPGREMGRADHLDQH